jgi:hypothetical protein
MMTAALMWIVLLLLASDGHADGVEVFFGELDYQEVEGNGAFQVVVTKMGVLQNPLFLTITPLTFDEFRREGHDLPDEEIFSQLNTIDPAEYEVNGRQDFDNTVRTLVVPAGRESIDQTISIPIVRDRINEAVEGFMLIVRANEALSNPSDLAKLNLINDGVCLLRITDDDTIIFRFERTAYTFSETAGVLRETIKVVKQQGNISEQTLTMFVDHTSLSAKFREDYEASGLRLVFAPDVTSLPVPIRILDDFLPEPLETFQLDLFTVVESPTLEIRGNKADVMITDNDEIEIGLEKTVYSMNEGETVEVCTVILGPEQIATGLEAYATLSAVPGTADENDYAVFMNIVFLTTEMRRICYSFTAIADGLAESTEFLTLQLQPIPDLTISTVNIVSSRQTAQVFINSNECVEGNHNCSENADCFDTPELFRCVCRDGFVGDGNVCTDIDECSSGIDNCHQNADCINLPGTFLCVCMAGYDGDGLDCRG